MNWKDEVKTFLNKKAVLSIGFALWISITWAQEKNDFITVTGKVQFVPSPEHQAKFPFLLKDSPGGDAVVLDTIEVGPDGSYAIKVPVGSPKFYSMDVYAWDRITFWGSTEDLLINFRGEDTAKVKIKNPPYILIENSEENEVVNMVNFISHQTYQNTIYAGKLQYQAMQLKDTLWEKKAVDLMMHQYEIAGEYYKKLVQIYKNDPAVLYAIQRMSWRRDSELMISTLDYLIKKYPWLEQAQQTKANILANLEQQKKIATGQPAAAFTLPDLKGKMVSLSDFKGKYLIIDFWASWCGPCRKENPHVKEVYEKYKSQGLEVLSVSIDTKKDNWKKAVEEDDLYWTQVISQEYKSLMNDYQFSGIPFMVLVDKEGKIIAKNLRGKSLDDQMTKLFE